MIPLNTILVYSIGSGCDTFYKVIKSTPKRVTVRRLESDVVKRYPESQSCDIRPSKKFYGEVTQTLGVKLDRFERLQIGPAKRYQGWHVWNKEPLLQYSP